METSLREPRPEKVAVVDEVRDRLASASAAILTEYRGLHVLQMQELRRALTAAGGEYKVFKNTLVRRAATEAGLESLVPMIEGPTAIAFVDGDVAAVAKVLRDFARANPSLVVKGGLIGTNLLDSRSTAALADLPSRDVLLAQLAGLLAAPMQRFAGLLQALPQKFAYGLRALIEERGGLPVEAPVEAAAPAAAEAPTEAPEAVSAPTEGDEAVSTDEAPAAAEAGPSDDAATTEEVTAEAPAPEVVETASEPVADEAADAAPAADDATA